MRGGDARWTGWGLRFCALLILAALVFFPAVKGLWLGYVLLVVSAGVAVVLCRYGAGCADWLSRKSWLRFTLMLLLPPVLVQLGLLLWVRPLPTSDALNVLYDAAGLVETGRMDPLTYYPPLQTWYYAAWFKLLGSSAWVAQVAQIPLYLGVVLMSWRLARLRWPEGSARLAALLTAWYPSLLTQVLATPYYQYLYILLVMVFAYALLRAVSKRSLVWAGWAGLAAGAAALTKATMLIAPVVVLAWLAVRFLTTDYTDGTDGKKNSDFGSRIREIRVIRGYLLLFVPFMLGFLLVLAPWSLRNYRVFHAWVPVCTSGGFVLHSANNPESNGLYSPIPDEQRAQTPEQMLSLSRESTQKAIHFIRENPAHAVKLALRKLVYTWGVEATWLESVNRSGSYDARLDRGLGLITQTAWIALVVMWGLSIWKRPSFDFGAFDTLVLVLFVMNAGVYMVFEGGDRHHLVMVPFMIVQALAPRYKTLNRPP